MSDRLLAVDDSPETLDVLRDVLAASGYTLETALSLEAMRRRFDQTPPDVVLLDWRLPDGDGITAIPEIKQHWPDTEVIVLTGYGTFDAAVQATKQGAFHFISKPFEIDVLTSLVKRACDYKRAHERSHRLQQVLADLGSDASTVFRSATMKSLFRLAERAAQSDAPVLITGEAGTGKEVFARLIHALSPRAQHPLLKVACNTVAADVAERELFGMARGRSGVSLADYGGILKRAGGGTVLLDQFTHWPLEILEQIAVVFAAGRWTPIGGDQGEPITCRLIALAREPVEVAVLENKIPESLLRLVGPLLIQMPPLRNRRDDIVPLAENALRRFAAQAASPVVGFTPAAAAAIENYDWPGHVRQLENEILALVQNVQAELIDVEHLPVAIRALAPRRGFGPKSWLPSWTSSEAAPKQPGLKVRLKRPA